MPGAGHAILERASAILARFVQPYAAMKSFRPCVLALAVASASAQTPVYFQLDWIFNAQFAGLYQAEAQGYFAEEGLDVTLAEAVKSVAVVDAVTDHPGIAFGSSESNVLLGYRSQGSPVVALATMFQDSPMGWMFLQDSGIETIEDFRGRDIGIHADGQKVLRVALAQAGMTVEDVNLIEVGYDPAVIVDGEAEAMQAYALDEYVSLQLQTGDAGNILMAKDHGYIAFSQVIFTTEAVAEAHPEVVTGMLRAVQRGWEYALANPEETVDLILSQYNPDLDRAYQIASLEAIRDLVKPGGAPALAPMTADRWARSQSVFLEYGFLQAPVDLDAFLRLDFMAALLP